MPSLKIDNSVMTPDIAQQLIRLCPFDAFEYSGRLLSVNAGCKMCRLCVKKGPEGVVTYLEDRPKTAADKSLWQGVAVYAEQLDGQLDPVVSELLGKARTLAGSIGQPVYALLAGCHIEQAAQQLLRYGADKVFVYDHEALARFRVLPYAAVFEDFIGRIKPSAILVGATNLGRSLAPRVAARFGAGLTADCTRLEMKANTDLVQIRPAFGGNIMAQIVTPNHRPQFCTVRYKVFDASCPVEANGEVVRMRWDFTPSDTDAQVLELIRRRAETDISEAEAIVAVGRGLKSQEDLALARALAEAMNAQLACTRPLIENGWMDAKRQIGLSGRTVKPKIIVTLGISGSVQFAAGMQNADCIIAVNQDPSAPIFNLAHYGLVGDLYEIIPRLLERIRTNERAVC